ncbi:MAG: GNAT family N-acetyltransferase [Gemmatimonadales bacterium]
MSLTIERIGTGALPAAVREEILSLCHEAYGENLNRYFDEIGPGVHLLSREDDKLVSHVMWVDRKLDPGNLPPLRTAYVELVGTRVESQGRGYATQLMNRLADEVTDYDLAALSPRDPAFYERLGWERWQGPLLVQRPSGIQTADDEIVMIRRLPNTPADLDLSASLAANWRPGEIW